MRRTFTSYRRNLPHWRLRGATYFVKWRLHPSQCDLSPSERDLVASSIDFFDTQRYLLFGYVVMNDHVHVIVRPGEEYELKSILHSWKSFTSHEIVKKGIRISPVWQHEYFDRIIRNEQEFQSIMAYMRSNPEKRWPGIQDYKWYAEKNRAYKD